MMREALLFQLDGEVPNVALMRLAKHPRELGDAVEFHQTAASHPASGAVLIAPFIALRPRFAARSPMSGAGGRRRRRRGVLASVRVPGRAVGRGRSGVDVGDAIAAAKKANVPTRCSRLLADNGSTRARPLPPSVVCACALRRLQR
jgi:hypothetical protein